jgi:hypothetical protein
MKAFVLIINILLFFHCQSQQYIWSQDSVSKDNPNYAMDRYHDVLRYHNPIMYLAYPYITPNGHRRVPLEDGEGKDGYWLEGNFAYRFTILNGKYYSPRFIQRLRPTLDVDALIRLTKDHSSPILPSNNKIGLGLDYLLSSIDALSREKVSIIWTTLQLHHFSNGQADSFFIENPIKRNNYTGGDFSTNYVRVLLNIGNISREKNIVTAGVGYQKEIDLGGPLSSSPELEHYYGSDRLLFNFQWVQKPKLATFNYQNRSTAEADTIQVQKRRQVSFRTQIEQILRGVSAFPGDKKRRLGWHTYFTYMPSVTNEVGLIFHTYLGRDYLNIRFDDAVFIAELGVCVRFNGR